MDSIEDWWWRPGICENDRMTYRLSLHRYGMEISFVMGNSIGIVNARIARASFEVPSVMFEPGRDLYGYVSDITFWDIKQISFKYISVGGGEFILLA